MERLTRALGDNSLRQHTERLRLCGVHHYLVCQPSWGGVSSSMETTFVLDAVEHPLAVVRRPAQAPTAEYVMTYTSD